MTDSLRVRPILFSGPMVRALLEGRKTQTRRVLKPQPEFLQYYEHKGKLIYQSSHRSWCSHGLAHGRYPDEYLPSMLGVCGYVPGDLLWVRETWQQFFRDELPPERATPVDGRMGIPARPDRKSVVAYRADGEVPAHSEHGEAVWRPSIFMPRWASRLTLRVSEVRVQRLQDISEGDACAEGAPCDKEACDHKRHTCNEIGCSGSGYRGGFAKLWDSLNAKRGNGAFSWTSNPWGVAVSFEVIKSNVDLVEGAPA